MVLGPVSRFPPSPVVHHCTITLFYTRSAFSFLFVVMTLTVVC